MRRDVSLTGRQPPILLVKWYGATKWLLERVAGFPKNQRFVFGQRIADRALGILEVLVEASYSPRKAVLLARANRELEVLRWLIRMATDLKAPFKMKRSVGPCADEPSRGQDARPPCTQARHGQADPGRRAVVADKAQTWNRNIVSPGIRGVEAWLPEKSTDEDRRPGVFRRVVERTIA